MRERITPRGVLFLAAALLVGGAGFASGNNLLFLVLAAMKDPSVPEPGPEAMVPIGLCLLALGLEEAPPDLVVLDRNPLENLRHTTAIRYVMKNGELYDAATLDQIWPEKKPLPRPYWWDLEPKARPDAPPRPALTTNGR